jgi:hypothetical protein
MIDLVFSFILGAALMGIFVLIIGFIHYRKQRNLISNIDKLVIDAMYSGAREGIRKSQDKTVN